MSKKRNYKFNARKFPGMGAIGVALGDTIPPINTFTNVESVLRNPNELKAIMQQGVATQFWQVLKYLIDADNKSLIRTLKDYGKDMPEVELKTLIEIINFGEKFIGLPETMITSAELQKETKPEELDPYFKTFEELQKYVPKS